MTEAQFRRDLTQAMSAFGYTQQSLSQATGITQSAISKFVNGKQRISAENLFKLWEYVYQDPLPAPTPRAQTLLQLTSSLRLGHASYDVPSAIARGQ